MDYEERTLYSTWNVSFQQILKQDRVAAELLKLMAYLDNQDLWYELFDKGVNNAPEWWTELQQSRVRFNRAISVLHNYSLIEVNAGKYSLHTCEHDWILEHLNCELDQERCRIAFHCVAANISSESETGYWVNNRRLLLHARRFKHARLKEAIKWSAIEPHDLHWLALIYEHNDMNIEAEKMYQRALDGYEKVWGPEHPSTRCAANNLRLLLGEQSDHLSSTSTVKALLNKVKRRVRKPKEER